MGGFAAMLMGPRHPGAILMGQTPASEQPAHPAGHLPKKSAVSKMGRYHVVHTMGTIKREKEVHSNLNTAALFQSEELHQAQSDESPKVVRGQHAGRKLPKLKTMPSPGRGHQHAPISRRLPHSAREPLQAGAFP